jgi:YHS domain-containing protein
MIQPRMKEVLIMAAIDNTPKDLTIKTIDPVCGMEVTHGETKLVSVYKVQSYRFCAEGCRRAFEADPEKYLEPKSKKKKGWFGGFLARLTKVNEKEFGCSGAKCH